MHQIHARRTLPLDWHRRSLALRRVLAADRPDILHTWLYETHLVGLVASLGRPETHVVLSHRSGTGVPRSARHLSALRLLRHRIDHAVANSQAGAEVMLRLGLEPRRVSVIANGLPVDRVAVSRDRATVRRELAIDQAVPVICAVTRPDETKDLYTLYTAFDVVRTKRPDAELVLVGATAEELREFGASLPAGARAIGFQERPVDYMNAADVLAISSRTEGHSNVADEGLMLGMPVVATDTGGHPPLVRMSGGRVVPVGRGDLLGSGLLEMLSAPPPREGVRAVAERHLSMVCVGDAMATLYAGLLSGDSARGLP